VTEWIFSPFHKSVFRASGLGLLTIFVITALSSLYPRPNLQQPTTVLALIDQILAQSPFLCLGLLLLLLSLTDLVLGLGSPGERSRQGVRDRMLVRGRALVGLAAVLYLALIPITLIQTQTLKNMSDRALNQQVRMVESQITPISEQLNRSSEAPSLATLKKQYPWIGRAEIQNLDELRLAMKKNSSQCQDLPG
jgi:competence protein ComGC